MEITERKVSGLLLECRACKQMLPRGRFGTHSTKADGTKRYRGQCKDCREGQRSTDRARRRRREAVPHWAMPITGEFIRGLFKFQQGQCACGCGRSLHAGYHIDHIKPLSKGGLHIRENLQLLATVCNLWKGAKDDHRESRIR